MIRILNTKIYLIIAIIIISCNNKPKRDNIINVEEKISIQRIDTSKKINKKDELKSNKKTKKPLDIQNLKCNIGVLAEIYATQNELDDKMIEYFLLTFDETCSLNIEYSEFSNELLFLVLNKSPQTIIELLSKNKKIKKSIILNTLRSPISDAIDIDELINKIMKVEGHDGLQKELLNSLKNE